MTTVEVLKAARARIEKGWGQGASARDKNGVVVVEPWNPCAAMWCARGALMAEPYEYGGMRYLYRALPITSLVLWNDDPSRTQADALALYDRAISLAEKEIP